MNQESIIQNLEDCHCNEDTISSFMNCYEKDDIKGQKRLLKKQRKELLNQVHECEKCISCLDYLDFQIDKDQ